MYLSRTHCESSHQVYRPPTAQRPRTSDDARTGNVTVPSVTSRHTMTHASRHAIVNDVMPYYSYAIELSSVPARRKMRLLSCVNRRLPCFAQSVSHFRTAQCIFFILSFLPPCSWIYVRVNIMYAITILSCNVYDIKSAKLLLTTADFDRRPLIAKCVVMSHFPNFIIFMTITSCHEYFIVACCPF